MQNFDSLAAMIDDVRRFSKKGGQRCYNTPTYPGTMVANFRKSFHREEAVTEFSQAADSLGIAYSTDSETTEHFAKVLDSLVDSLYVILGTALQFGLASYLAAGFEEVSKSNWSKFDADGNPIIDPETGKILKGDQYRPPNLVKVLENGGATDDTL